MKHDLEVNLDRRSYHILIGDNPLSNIATECQNFLVRDEVWIVSDENILKNYRHLLISCFQKANIKVNLFELPAGEHIKSISYLEKLTDWLIETGIERQDLVIAFGGGVIGDLVGFASAVTLRGVNFVQVPTTLLAQVDSSVGGKTGINSKFGKNMIGCFYQPKQVLIYTETLQTLSKRDLRSGYSEIIKYGLLWDKSFFDWLEKNGKRVLLLENEPLNEAIYRSCMIKANIVSLDERETGTRALLNLGHTFAHALESAVGYSGQLLHGEAVSVGIVLATDVSSRMGYCTKSTLDQVKKHFVEMGLKTLISEIDFSFPSSEKLVELMLKDKKVNNGLINFVLLKDIGDAFVTSSVDLSLVREALDSSKEAYDS